MTQNIIIFCVTSLYMPIFYMPVIGVEFSLPNLDTNVFQHNYFGIFFVSRNYDKENKTMPNLQLVFSRFRKIYIHGYFHVAPMVASLNQNKRDVSQTYELFPKFGSLTSLNDALNKSNEANEIFPGTVSTLYFTGFHYSVLHDLQKFSESASEGTIKYNVGLEMTINWCLDNSTKITDWSIYASNFTFKLPWKFQNHFDNAEELVRKTEQKILECRNKLIDTSANVSVAFLLTYPDTDNLGRVNQTALIFYWISMSKWAEREQVMIFMDQAIDSTETTTEIEYFNGWWNKDGIEKIEKPVVQTFSSKLLEYVCNRETEITQNISGFTLRIPSRRNIISPFTDPSQGNFSVRMYSTLGDEEIDGSSDLLSLLPLLYDRFSDVFIESNFDDLNSRMNYLNAFTTFSLIKRQCEEYAAFALTATPIVTLTEQLLYKIDDFIDLVRYTNKLGNSLFQRILVVNYETRNDLSKLWSVVKHKVNPEEITIGSFESVYNVDSPYKLSQWIARELIHVDFAYLEVKPCYSISSGSLNTSDIIKIKTIAQQTASEYTAIYLALVDTFGSVPVTLGISVDLDTCSQYLKTHKAVAEAWVLLSKLFNSVNIPVNLGPAFSRFNDNDGEWWWLNKTVGKERIVSEFDLFSISDIRPNVDIFTERRIEYYGNILKGNPLCTSIEAVKAFRDQWNITFKEVSKFHQFHRDIFTAYLSFPHLALTDSETTWAEHYLPYIYATSRRFSKISILVPIDDEFSSNSPHISMLLATKLLQNLQRDCGQSQRVKLDVTITFKILFDQAGDVYKTLRAIGHAARITGPTFNNVLLNIPAIENNESSWNTSLEYVKKIHLGLKRFNNKLGIIYEYSHILSDKEFHKKWNLYMQPYITVAYISYSLCVDSALSKLYRRHHDLMQLKNYIQLKHVDFLQQNPHAGIFVDVSGCHPDRFNIRHEAAVQFWLSFEQFGIAKNIQVMLGPAFSKEDEGFGEWWRLWKYSGDKITVEESNGTLKTDGTSKTEGTLKTDYNNWTTWGIPVTVFVVMFIALFCVLLKYYLVNRKRNMFLREVITAFLEGSNSDRETIPMAGVINGTNLSKHIFCVAYDKSYEIRRSAYVIDESLLLGSGCYGKVLKVTLKVRGREIQSAMKSAHCTDSQQISSFRSLLLEIKVLTHLGKHDNVIQFLGANTSEINTGKVYIFLELCQLGSLNQYLKNQNSPPTENTPPCAYAADGVSYSELLRWSLEIAQGMEFISSKYVVHADLATRNVLLDEHKTAKICDFGLSRRMENYQDYVKTHQEPLPWRWMAFESLARLEFSTMSDVWSYGVTLWEIFSQGHVPYQGLSWDVGFSNLLEGGMRLPKPTLAPKALYDIMLSCWTLIPQGRPKFQQILHMLKEASKECTNNPPVKATNFEFHNPTTNKAESDGIELSTYSEVLGRQNLYQNFNGYENGYENVKHN